MKKLTILLLLMYNTFSIVAKDGVKTSKSFMDVFPGKPVITIFANSHLGLGKNSNNSDVELKRAYLGYKFDDGTAWSGSVIFDIASADFMKSNLEFKSSLKNAFVSWSKDKLKLNIGIIKTNNFGTQEKAWGHRYIMKSFSDEYGIAPSADLGVSASYKFSDRLTADISVTNGNGNRKLKINDHYRYAWGVTYKATESITVRAFYDLYSKDKDKDMVGLAQHTVSAFIGYKHTRFSVSGEYNYMLNSDYNKGVNLGGFAVYSTVNVAKKLTAFARYDRFSSNSNSIKDQGSAIRTGLAYSPFKFLKISPNIYNWTPIDSASQTYLYLNLLVNF